MFFSRVIEAIKRYATVLDYVTKEIFVVCGRENENRILEIVLRMILNKGKTIYIKDLIE